MPLDRYIIKYIPSRNQDYFFSYRAENCAIKIYLSFIFVFESNFEDLSSRFH